ncbi:TVP38/TMEM64 family protein [Legionella sp. km772]|uniref:TVP38/TMEM64 family protein n=1 Tax=Legionella sp. km772 TaxID=2498111 RepID=UPI001F21AF86|nr:TVP38/TMEM64 family protein [Legionella sp. km772]
MALLAFLICAFTFQKYSLEIIDWIDDLGWLAPVLFIIVYSLATILFLPTMLMTLAGGAIFGPIIGVILNLIGASLGAAFSFLITRYLVYDWFNKKRGLRLNKLITGVERKGWMFIAFLRLFPIVPFNLVNYGLGLTAIPFRTYLISTALFLIPAEIIYTYFGYAGRHVLANPGQFYKSGGVFLLALALLFLAMITLIKRRERTQLFKNNMQTE